MADDASREDQLYSRMAIDEARKCIGEEGNPRPLVGAVAIRNGRILATAYRGELKPGEHAEYTLLERKLGSESIAGATVYTTLEPCTVRNPPKIPCVERLIDRKVSRVVIGMVDPNLTITGKGVLALRAANVEVQLFSGALAAEIEELNREFRRAHSSSRRSVSSPAGAAVPSQLEANPVAAAIAVLGGDVSEAVAFENFATSKAYVAAIRRQSRRDWQTHVYLLERLGETYREIWRSPDLYRTVEHKIEALDVDGDGVCELVFDDESHGTAAGQRYLYVYFPIKKELYRVQEDFEWGRLGRAPSPAVSLEPEPPANLLHVIEAHAIRRGFLKRSERDLDNPLFAAARWLRDNGEDPDGEVSIHYYEGMPASGNSVTTRLETAEFLWLGYFKGPLCCYEKASNRHFVAYAPDWKYDWANCLAWDGQHLWFGVHCQKGLRRFDYAAKVLRKITRAGGQELPEVQSLNWDESHNLVVNGEMRLPLDTIRTGR